MRRQQETRPRTHDRKVITGRDGSSVSGTTRATSSTEHRSSEGSSALPLDLSAAAEESGCGGEFENIEKNREKQNRTEQNRGGRVSGFREWNLRQELLGLCFFVSLSYLSVMRGRERKGTEGGRRRRRRNRVGKSRG